MVSPAEQAAFEHYADSVAARARIAREREVLKEAVAFARGNGFMLPRPELAESHHAVSLLRFAERFLEGGGLL